MRRYVHFRKERRYHPKGEGFVARSVPRIHHPCWKGRYIPGMPGEEASNPQRQHPFTHRRLDLGQGPTKHLSTEFAGRRKVRQRKSLDAMVVPFNNQNHVFDDGHSIRSHQASRPGAGPADAPHQATITSIIHNKLMCALCRGDYPMLIGGAMPDRR